VSHYVNCDLIIDREKRRWPLAQQVSAAFMHEASTPQEPAGSRKVLGDTVFTVAERIISQAAQFTIFVVAARILGPAEFGIFALASAGAILLLRVAEVGWAPFIMSQSGDSTVPRQVLLLAILAGIAVGAFGVAGSLLGGVVGLEPDTVLLLALFSIWVTLANTSSAQKGILIWSQRMKASAICEIIGELVGLCVAIGSLLMGWGILALAFGRLSFQLTHLIISFGITRMTPLRGMDRNLLKELWTFSAQIFTSRLLINLRLYAATFIIGGYLGPLAVGYFRAADRLVSAVAEIIAVPGQLLAWTLLRRARDNGDEAGQAERINKQVSLHFKVLVAAGTPVLVWLMIMSHELIGGMLSDEWLPAAPLVAILAISRLLFLFGIVTEPLLSIVGEAKRLPAFTVMVLIISVVLTYGAVQMGLYAVAWSQVVVAGLVLWATLWLFRKYAGVVWMDVALSLRGSVLPLACGIATLAALDWLARGMGIPDLVEALGFGLIAVGVYAFAIKVFDPEFWRQLKSGNQIGSDV
jgi:O-antigen/teichoic acid export membrane protein